VASDASPITSAPGGTLNTNFDGSSGGLRSNLLNSNVVVWPSLSASCMNLSASPAKPSRTDLKSVSLRLGSRFTHCTAPSCWDCVTLKLSSSVPSPLSNMAGVADKDSSTRRTVTCSRSLS
jgi:hypothetical protein